MRLRNLYRLTFHPSPQWQQLSLWQRWSFILGGWKPLPRLDVPPGEDPRNYLPPTEWKP